MKKLPPGGWKVTGPKYDDMGNLIGWDKVESIESLPKEKKMSSKPRYRAPRSKQTFITQDGLEFTTYSEAERHQHLEDLTNWFEKTIFNKDREASLRAAQKLILDWDVQYKPTTEDQNDG